MLFSIFLMTYLFLESRCVALALRPPFLLRDELSTDLPSTARSANYNRGATFVLAYLALMGGFLFAPANRDTSDDPGFDSTSLAFAAAAPAALPLALRFKAVLLSLFTR